MKKLLRFYEDDLKNIIMEQYDVRPSQITSIYTEDYDEGEHLEPIFYIEVELNESE